MEFSDQPLRKTEKFLVTALLWFSDPQIFVWT